MGETPYGSAHFCPKKEDCNQSATKDSWPGFLGSLPSDYAQTMETRGSREGSSKTSFRGGRGSHLLRRSKHSGWARRWQAQPSSYHSHNCRLPAHSPRWRTRSTRWNGRAGGSSGCGCGHDHGGSGSVCDCDVWIFASWPRRSEVLSLRCRSGQPWQHPPSQAHHASLC